MTTYLDATDGEAASTANAKRFYSVMDSALRNHRLMNAIAIGLVVLRSASFVAAVRWDS